jgi:hypothetical protein
MTRMSQGWDIVSLYYANTCDPDHGDGYSYCEWADHKCPTAGPSGDFKSGESNLVQGEARN